MARRIPDCLSGAMIATAVESGSRRGMKLELLLRMRGQSAVSIVFMDSYRFELSSEDGIDQVRMELETSESSDNGARCPLVDRAQDVLGGAAMHRSTCEIWLPDLVLPEIAYLGFSIGQPSSLGQEMATATVVPWDRSPDCIYLEAQRRALGIGKHGARKVFFLTTRQQANDRIESIARKYGLFDRDDDASMVALTKLYLGIISGEDGPLLNEWDGNDE